LGEEESSPFYVGAIGPYFLLEKQMKKKVLFHQDGYLNGVLTYERGQVYEIDDTLGSASRWLKRGAEFVEEEAKVEVKAKQQEEEEELVANEEGKEENKKGKKK
jgi:hypothetical protein